MGSIAARDALRVIELTEQVAAAHILACTQGLRIRLRDGELRADHLGPGVAAFLEQVDPIAPMVEEDRPLDEALRRLCAMTEADQWPLSFDEAA
jgi:histidine ammonia-lyase